MARPGLERNRKFVFLLSVVRSRPLARGLLDCMWESGYESGDPILGDPKMVEFICGWTGAPNVLFTALRDAGGANQVGFIEPVPGRTGDWQIHHLLENAPDYVRRRARRDAERRRAAGEDVAAVMRALRGGGNRRLAFDGGLRAIAAVVGEAGSER